MESPPPPQLVLTSGDEQQQKLSFRPSATPFTSPPSTLRLDGDNSELTNLRLALARARSEASLARQLRRENNRLKAECNRLQTELELRNNQLCPGSPTSTLHMKDIVAFDSCIAGSSADVTTERAIQTLLRNFDSFNMLSKEEDKSTGNWVEGQLIGEDLLSDDDSCSYSV